MLWKCLRFFYCQLMNGLYWPISKCLLFPHIWKLRDWLLQQLVMRVQLRPLKLKCFMYSIWCFWLLTPPQKSEWPEYWQSSVKFPQKETSQNAFQANEVTSPDSISEWQDISHSCFGRQWFRCVRINWHTLYKKQLHWHTSLQAPSDNWKFNQYSICLWWLHFNNSSCSPCSSLCSQNRTLNKRSIGQDYT